MKPHKIMTLTLSLLVTAQAYSIEIYAPALDNDKVHVKGQVIQIAKHENISCLYISSNKLDKNGDVIPWSHQSGGDVMACSDKPLINKSLKNKFVSIDGEFVSMNHDKNNQNLESYPIVKIKRIEKINLKRPSYVSTLLPYGYHNPGFFIHSN